MSKEVATHTPVKSRLDGNAAVMLQQTGEGNDGGRRLRERVERVNEDWLKLITSLPDNENDLTMARLHLLPSRQAYLEMLVWLDGIEEILKLNDSRGDDGRMSTCSIDLEMIINQHLVSLFFFTFTAAYTFIYVWFFNARGALL